MRHTDIAAVKAPAVIQENSQLFVQGHVQSATWQKDTASKVSQIEDMQIEIVKHDIKNNIKADYTNKTSSFNFEITFYGFVY